ncbi:Histone H1-like nucleoprotein HC2 [Symmachiella macrocystis]|uniref:Histone H1-like nucleoprotein HC2 n=1 Tax=Symmachiella macrocystis TaxID=2527985 RepID=A0A5C6AUA5_9PLAN|nr:HTH domain-containing protein [Symmachiella macrocystis]TWU03057.1 Histone H1-like nucleoprotein HC2 [Symmachiella macrocystis]
MATKKTTAKKATTKKTATRKQATAKKAPAKAATKKPAAKKVAAKTGVKKLSALDAAAKVLGETKEPLNARGMIERMAAKGYWISPGGKTPHATLYAAILREIQTKGKEARFAKTDRGHFALIK